MKRRLLAEWAVAAGLMFDANAAETLSSVPTDSWTVTDYYKQAIDDPKESKIGDIDDVLVCSAGKVTGLVIGAGRFLGAGEKNVIVPYSLIQKAMRETSSGSPSAKKRTI